MDTSTIIVIVIFLVLVAAVVACYFFRAKENYPYTADYATLGNMYSQRLFEPDAVGRCARGSYMYSDNPGLGRFCSTVPPEVLRRMACSRPYVGRPYHASYSAPANACGCAPSTCGCGTRKLRCGVREPALRLD